jgi:hypothetical protein
MSTMRSKPPQVYVRFHEICWQRAATALPAIKTYHIRLVTRQGLAAEGRASLAEPIRQSPRPGPIIRTC